ncbi:hypothetical protein DsansV1_C35g0230921 [Dioscorea sansibarensis]
MCTGSVHDRRAGPSNAGTKPGVIKGLDQEMVIKISGECLSSISILFSRLNKGG